MSVRSFPGDKGMRNPPCYSWPAACCSLWGTVEPRPHPISLPDFQHSGFTTWRPCRQMRLARQIGTGKRAPRGRDARVQASSTGCRELLSVRSAPSHKIVFDEKLKNMTLYNIESDTRVRN